MFYFVLLVIIHCFSLNDINNSNQPINNCLDDSFDRTVMIDSYLILKKNIQKVKPFLIEAEKKHKLNACFASVLPNSDFVFGETKDVKFLVSGGILLKRDNIGNYQYNVYIGYSKFLSFHGKKYLDKDSFIGTAITEETPSIKTRQNEGLTFSIGKPFPSNYEPLPKYKRGGNLALTFVYQKFLIVLLRILD